MSDGFFDQAMQTLEEAATPNNLVVAIKHISDWYKNAVNWDAIDINHMNIGKIHFYEQSLGLVFQPVCMPSDFKHCFYPLLLQLNNSEEFVALLPGQKLKNKLDIKQVKSVWQCVSVQSTFPVNLYGLYALVFKLFKKDLLKAAMLNAFFSVISLSMVLLTGYIFNHLHDFNGYEFFILYFSCLSFIGGFAFWKYLNEHYLMKMNEKLQIHIMPMLWHHFLYTPLKTIKKWSSAACMQRINDYKSSISTVLTTNIMLLTNLTCGLFLLMYMLYCNFLVSISYLLIYLFVGASKLFAFTSHSAFISSYLSKQGEVSTVLTEAFLQIDKIRSANKENMFHKIWLYKLLIAKQHLEKSVKLEIKLWLVDIALPALMLIILYLYLYFNSSWESYYQLQYMVCAAQLSLQFEKISIGVIALSHQLPGLRRVAEVIDREFKHIDYIENKQPDHHDIVLSNVSLKKSDRRILDNITMRIQPGCFVGVMGPSGAGKSTLFRLILGLESDYAGCICVDGQDIKQQNMSLLRQKIGVVLQTTNVFPGTIFSNIAANKSITLNDAWQLAKEVGLFDDIQKMPMKMYTHISDNAGESLSGGQKQKLLIARALASRPTYLLLDEATSALDNKSQALIFNHLKSLNITLIVIAHRISTIVDADLIYVLNNGSIVNQAKYSELEL
ncbi:MAG: ATP-binding cassette domain-containing protein [Gammaproteobacteria bacterium]